MAWFKHDNDASDDIFIQHLEEKYGLEGYARYFKILEKASAALEKTGQTTVTIPWASWQSFLKGKRNKIETFLEYARNENKITSESNGNILEISVPKMLEKRENRGRKNTEKPAKPPIYEKEDNRIKKEPEANASVPPTPKGDAAENKLAGMALPWADDVPPRDLGNWALSEFPGIGKQRVVDEWLKFRDHWLVTKKKTKRTEKGWKSTWYNWCRKSFEGYSPRQSQPSQAGYQHHNPTVKAVGANVKVL